MKEKNTYNDDLGANNLPESLRVNTFVVPEGFFEDQKEKIVNLIKLENFTKSDFNTEESLPTGYFNELENNILARISELKLKETIDSDGFETPQTYFDELGTSIQNRLSEENLRSNIVDEGFSIPADYFETLNNSISAKISEDKLRSFVESDGFNTPDSYFENFESELKGKIFIENISDRNLDNPFQVPTDYFENQENKILSKVKEESTIETNTPIITLPVRKSNWAKYSVAAAILLVGVGTYFSFNSDKVVKDTPVQNISANIDFEGISDEELINYLAQVSEDDDDLLNLTQIVENKTGQPLRSESDIKEDEIEEYLNYML